MYCRTHRTSPHFDHVLPRERPCSRTSPPPSKLHLGGTHASRRVYGPRPDRPAGDGRQCRHLSQSFSQTARVTLQAAPSGCENNPGPFITLNGELALSGASARITLSNNTKGTHTASTDVSADVVIIPAGQSIQIAKQPSRGGVG